jgi:hypothetical protein
MKKQTISEGRQQILFFMAILKNVLELKKWTTSGYTKRIGNLSSVFQKADSQWGQTDKYSSAA